MKPPGSAESKLLDELEFLDDTDMKDDAVNTGLEELVETVVVTATKQKQSVAEAPAIVSVVTAGRIREMGYRTLAEALGSLPGIYLLNDHVEWNAGVRGVNGGRRAGSRIMKVMIDGQPVAFRPSTANWLGEELIPIEAVSRIEVVRGPASALYGANAFLGVVNIITKNGALAEGALISGRSGVVEGKAAGGGSLLLGTKTGNTEVVLAVSGAFSDRSGLPIKDVPNRATFSGARSKDDTSTPASVFAKAFYQSSALGSVGVDLSFQRLHSHGEFQDWGPLIRGRDAIAPDYRKNLISLQNLYVRARLSRVFLNNFGLALSAAYSSAGPTDADQVAIDQKGFGDFFKRDYGSDAIDFIGELTYRLKEINAFALGVDFANEWHRLLTYWSHTLPRGSDDPYLVEPTRNEVLGDRTFRNLGAYLQGVLYPFQLFNARYLQTLGVTLGVRYDNHNLYGDALNYRVGGVLLWRRWSGKVLFGTSFKAPASVQLFTGQLRRPGGVIGNPALSPETAKTVEVQLGGEVFPGFNATATWFFNIIDNKVELVTDPQTRTNVCAQNVATITGTGAELDLQLSWKDLSGFANVSYQRSTLKKRDPLGSGSVSESTSLYPAFMAKLGLSYRYPRIYLGASAAVQYISSVLSSEPNAQVFDPVSGDAYSLDGYAKLDLSLYTVGLELLRDRETRVQLKASNVTGASYFYPGFRDFDIPALGRSIHATISQEL